MSDTTKIRVTMATNAAARRVELKLPGWVNGWHNGGKVVIVTVDTDDLDAAREALEEDPNVVEFEVRS